MPRNTQLLLKISGQDHDTIVRMSERVGLAQSQIGVMLMRWALDQLQKNEPETFAAWYAAMPRRAGFPAVA